MYFRSKLLIFLKGKAEENINNRITRLMLEIIIIAYCKVNG
jgi:hypothetical protein